MLEERTKPMRCCISYLGFTFALAQVIRERNRGEKITKWWSATRFNARCIQEAEGRRAILQVRSFTNMIGRSVHRQGPGVAGHSCTEPEETGDAIFGEWSLTNKVVRKQVAIYSCRLRAVWPN